MPVLAGRLYSKTILWQGDPNATPVNTGGPVPAAIVASPLQPVPWRSTTITRVGDSTSAPVNVGGPVPTQLVATPPQALPWRSTAIVKAGDPNAAPAVQSPPPAPIVVQPATQPQQRGMVAMSAAAAEITMSGPLIVTPSPQRPWTPPAVIVRQLQDGAVVPQGGPVPTTIVATSSPQLPRPPFVIVRAAPVDQTPPVAATPSPVVVIPPAQPTARPLVLTWQQLQDGFVASAGGPVPTTLVITPARLSVPPPGLIMLLAASSQPPALSGPSLVVSAYVRQRPAGGTALVIGGRIDATGSVPAPVLLAMQGRTAGPRGTVVLVRGGTLASVRPPVTFDPVDGGGRARNSSTGYASTGQHGTADRRGVDLG